MKKDKRNKQGKKKQPKKAERIKYQINRDINLQIERLQLESEK